MGPLPPGRGTEGGSLSCRVAEATATAVTHPLRACRVPSGSMLRRGTCHSSPQHALQCESYSMLGLLLPNPHALLAASHSTAAAAPSLQLSFFLPIPMLQEAASPSSPQSRVRSDKGHASNVPTGASVAGSIWLAATAHVHVDRCDAVTRPSSRVRQ
jgi:hypothetical protein